jgi:hypothetical protein
MVYGAQAKASHSALMMIVKAIQGMIDEGRLPYVIKKERNGKSVSLGLHPRPRRR